MSLVPTWVQAVNGLYYKNPVLKGTDYTGGKWFICFDDDDPPELVVEAGGHPVTKGRAMTILNELGIKYTLYPEPVRLSSRIFGKTVKDGFTEAGAVFLRIHSPIPVPEEYEELGSRNFAIEHDCCLYEFPGFCPPERKSYTLIVTDPAGEEIYRTEVDLRVPATIGWNLTLEAGRTGLAEDIEKTLREHESTQKTSGS